MGGTSHRVQVEVAAPQTLTRVSGSAVELRGRGKLRVVRKHFGGCSREELYGCDVEIPARPAYRTHTKRDTTKNTMDTCWTRHNRATTMHGLPGSCGEVSRVGDVGEF